MVCLKTIPFGHDWAVVPEVQAPKNGCFIAAEAVPGVTQEGHKRTVRVCYRTLTLAVKQHLNVNVLVPHAGALVDAFPAILRRAGKAARGSQRPFPPVQLRHPLA